MTKSRLAEPLSGQTVKRQRHQGTYVQGREEPTMMMRIHRRKPATVAAIPPVNMAQRLIFFFVGRRAFQIIYRDLLGFSFTCFWREVLTGNGMYIK